MLKLLIADSSNIATNSISQLLATHYDLCVCHDGNIALQVLAEFQPDILIINLMLPHVDGLGVLQQTSFKPRIIIAMTTYVSSYMEHLLIELGVDYIMIAPSSYSLRARLEDLVRKQVIVSDPQDFQSLTTAYLHAMNFPTHTAIQIAWSHRNDNIWSKYFPPGSDGAISCPTNKEFICRMAEYLQR